MSVVVMADQKQYFNVTLAPDDGFAIHVLYYTMMLD
jgi:hypothetical protein